VIFSGEVPTPMKLTSSFFRPARSNSCVVSQTSLMRSDDTPMTMPLRSARLLIPFAPARTQSARFIGAAIAASMLAPRSIAAMADSGCVLEI
jgi:hypothetical protein